MRFACWIPKATDTHSEYVIFIVFPRQIGFADASPYVTRHSTLPILLYMYNLSVNVFSPTDAQLDSLKNNIKFALKLTLKSCYMFRCETPSSGSIPSERC